jgi:hypothetical protein
MDATASTIDAGRIRSSRVVPFPRRWGQVRERFHERRWLKSPIHRGEHGTAEKTIAQGMPDCFGEPVVTLPVWCCSFHPGLRVRQHPAFPAPSSSRTRCFARPGRENRAAGMRRRVSNSVVIPGRRAAAGPESITTIVSMDSGFAPRGAPRNDESVSCLKGSSDLQRHSSLLSSASAARRSAWRAPCRNPPRAPPHRWRARPA